MVMASKEEPLLSRLAPSPNRGCGESCHGLCIRRLAQVGHTRVMNVARDTQFQPVARASSPPVARGLGLKELGRSAKPEKAKQLNSRR